MKTKLKNGERVVLTTRPHWFTMVVPVFLTIGAIVLGIVIGSYALWVLPVCALYILYKLVERNNNIWVVTNLRIVDEYGVFSNNSKESPLDKINNVTYQQSLWGKLFGFGNVQIQTAAEIGSTTYNMVQYPARLKDAITQMQEDYKSEQIRRQANELAQAMTAGQANTRMDVPAELERLFELKQKGIITEEEFAARKARLLNT